MKRRSSPKDVDDYIDGSDEEARPKLQELRELIQATIPQAEERIWYDMPYFQYKGELVGLSAFDNHVNFGIGAEVLHDDDRRALEDKGYKTGIGSIEIAYDQKLPAKELKKLLKAKAKLNESESRID
jgi:uncharacterized protein